MELCELLLSQLALITGFHKQQVKDAFTQKQQQNKEGKRQ